MKGAFFGNKELCYYQDARYNDKNRPEIRKLHSLFTMFNRMESQAPKFQGFYLLLRQSSGK